MLFFPERFSAGFLLGCPTELSNDFQEDGRVSDESRTKRGRRRTWVLCTGIVNGGYCLQKHTMKHAVYKKKAKLTERCRTLFSPFRHQRLKRTALFMFLVCVVHRLRGWWFTQPETLRKINILGDKSANGRMGAHL